MSHQMCNFASGHPRDMVLISNNRFLGMGNHLGPLSDISDRPELPKWPFAAKIRPGGTPLNHNFGLKCYRLDFQTVQLSICRTVLQSSCPTGQDFKGRLNGLNSKIFGWETSE